MKREHKDKFIQEIVDLFLSNDFLILVNFKSINASESLTLRNNLKSISGGGFLVVKNTLARLALSRINKFSTLSNKFLGPVGIIYSSAIVESAKLVDNFIKDHENKMSIICAAHLNQLLMVEDVKKLANFPSLDELRIKIMHLISPTRLMSSINLSTTSLLRVLKQYSSKK